MIKPINNYWVWIRHNKVVLGTMNGNKHIAKQRFYTRTGLSAEEAIELGWKLVKVNITFTEVK